MIKQSRTEGLNTLSMLSLKTSTRLTPNSRITISKVVLGMKQQSKEALFSNHAYIFNLNPR